MSWKLACAAALSSAVVLALAHGGCGSDSNDATDDGGALDGATDGAGDAPACATSADCASGGACVAGRCCDAKLACGAACCNAGDVCLFQQCVTPGKQCTSAGDCPAGQYCDPTFGTSYDGGAVPFDGGRCTQPLPTQGRCLPLPPKCDDAGTSSPSCVATCEYHPPAGGPLSAKAKWQWGPTAKSQPDYSDVWSTPTIGRIYDGNCDGKVDELDPPNVVFVSGRAIDASTGKGTCCQCTGTTPTSCVTGVLRMLDGRTGQEVWSVAKPSASSSGFAGLSVAIGDVDGDGAVDVLAVTGEGYVVMLDRNGSVVRTSDQPIPGHGDATFGWGGGLALADMDNDGAPEIAYGATVFSTTGGKITLKFTGNGGIGAEAVYEAMSTFADLDQAPDGHLELLAGKTAYLANGTTLWNRTDLADGFPGVGDFDKNGTPETVLVGGGKVWVLDGATGATVLGPATLPGTGSGGPPTVADFDGDGKPEIGVAQANYYAVLKPNFTGKTLDLLWKTQNHDLSSSVTGSTVFDFEGDGKSEVVYADECFLWVFDGTTGKARFAAPHSSFTGTEASLVADIDGDGHAEMLMVSNGADPSSAGWGCMDASGTPVTMNGFTWKPGPTADKGYRGLVLFGDTASSWVGTRTLWNEHTYHVSNICDDRDNACTAPNAYGSIPKTETRNWTLPWLDDFRQNVQDKGLFNAPDAVVALAVDCVTPVVAHVTVRNIGEAGLPAGVDVGVFDAKGDVQVGKGTTTLSLLPGQTQTLDVPLSAPAGVNDTFYAKIIVDPANPTFHECRDDNDQSGNVQPSCVR